jgi:UDP-glucose 4-epimerase
MLKQMIRVGVTGYTGFVGEQYMEQAASGMTIERIDLRNRGIDQLDLTDTDVIVHLAGKAHEMKPIPEEIYYQVNFELTRSLADLAKASGVKQFVYISSTKVYGDETDGVIWNEMSVCRPQDAYGKSKRMAEEYLLSISSDLFKVAIIRPPLVYGPRVKGNMVRLLQLADRGIPLPFGNTGNQRSMVFVGNLIALINKVIVEKAAGIFIAGDAKPIATDELIRLMRKYLGNDAGLISIPAPLRSAIRYARPSLYTRLFGSFVVDNNTTNKVLSFAPPFSCEDGVREMAAWYKSKKIHEQSV